LDSQPISTSEKRQQAKSDAERRRAPRYPSDLTVSCRPLLARESGGWQARVLNISRSGIALVLARRFERGALLSMDLEGPQQAVSRSVLARVVHARPDDNNAWIVGCVFSSELLDEELHAFSAERVKPVEPDCRAWVRFSCDVATVCRPEGDAAGREVAARIVNVSPTGVALLVSSPWENGKLLRLQLPSMSGRPGRSVLIRVAQVAATADGEWTVGCEIVDQLSMDVLEGLLA
jgi:hypothetical protein